MLCCVLSLLLMRSVYVQHDSVNTSHLSSVWLSALLSFLQQLCFYIHRDGPWNAEEAGAWWWRGDLRGSPQTRDSPPSSSYPYWWFAISQSRCTDKGIEEEFQYKWSYLRGPFSKSNTHFLSRGSYHSTSPSHPVTFFIMDTHTLTFSLIYPLSPSTALCRFVTLTGLNHAYMYYSASSQPVITVHSSNWVHYILYTFTILYIYYARELHPFNLIILHQIKYSPHAACTGILT